MANCTAEDVRELVGDPGGKTALIEKRPFFLSGTSTLGNTKAPQKEAEAKDNEWMDKVPVVYNTEDKNAVPGEDGSVAWKRTRGVESTGKRKQEMSGTDRNSLPREEESREEEPQESAEEKAARLEEQLAQQTEQKTDQEEDNKETEIMSEEKIRVFMSAGGFDVRSYFRDVQYNDTEAYIVLVYHPDDEVALPRKGNDVEIKTEDMEPKVFRLSKYHLRITGTEFTACILDELTDFNGSEVDR